MKKLFPVFAVALIFLALNCIPKYVISHNGADGNLWTTHRSNPNEVLFRSRPARGDFCQVSGYHFGFPLRAFYYDRGNVVNRGQSMRLGEPVWFAKLDSLRAIANTFIFLVVTFVFMMTAILFKRIKLKSLNTTQ